MKVLGVAGYSDAGKTTLVERLVPRLRERGRVGTVKAIHHDIEVDRKGTDTDRHRRAGAHTVVGVTPSFTFRIDEGGKGTETAEELAALDAALSDLDGDVDYVLVEGFKEAALPTVVVGDIDEDRVGGEVLLRVDVDDPDAVDRCLERTADLPEYGTAE